MADCSEHVRRFNNIRLMKYSEETVLYVANILMITLELTHRVFFLNFKLQQVK